VTERDAFGDPIADGPTSTPQPPAAEAPVFALPTIPAYGPSRRSWWGRAIAAAVVVAFAAPFAIGGWIAWNALHTAKTAVGVVTAVRDLAPTASGVTGASMLAAPNLARALRSARRDPGGRLGLLRVAPARADLQLTRKSGGLDLLQVRAGGGRTLMRTQGTGPTKAIIFSSIDVRAPARLVRAAAERLCRSPDAIDYVVLIDVAGGPKWSASFQGGALFQGDAHGRVTRRIQ
jgi:hypothetical protein